MKMFMGLFSMFLPIILIGAAIFAASRYKRCPSNKVIVVRKKKRELQDGYKKICYLKGTFYNPIVEEIKVLHLAPRVCDVNVERVKTKDDVLVFSFPMTFTYSVYPNKGLVEKAAEKLLDLEEREINNLGQKIIEEQVINVVRDITYKQLNFDREFFVKN